jgi:hypothetical protein
VKFFGVVTSLDESVVESFPTREQAEAFIAEVDQDAEAELLGTLRVGAVEFETAEN